jgi:hypothetical protein
VEITNAELAWNPSSRGKAPTHKHLGHALIAALLLAPAILATTTGCATAPAKSEVELYETLPPGKAVYFGLDIASSGDILTLLATEDGTDDVTALIDRVRRVVGYADAEGELAFLAYGRFTKAVGRIALRRSGFKKASSPDWAPRRATYTHAESGLHAVVVGPGVVAIGADPPRALVEGYGASIPPLGPVGDEREFPVSLVSTTDGAVVARFDLLSQGSGLPLRGVAPRTASAWMVRTADEVYAVQATLWFREGKNTRPYVPLLRLALSGWLTANPGLESMRIRNGLAVESLESSITLELPALTAEEAARVIRSILRQDGTR